LLLSSLDPSFYHAELIKYFQSPIDCHPRDYLTAIPAIFSLQGRKRAFKRNCQFCGLRVQFVTLLRTTKMVLSNRHELGEVLYTKFVLYEMAWGKISLQGETKVCGAPMGGPIAVVQEHSKMVNKEGSKKSICIYSSSGRFLSEVILTYRRILHHLHFMAHRLM